MNILQFHEQLIQNYSSFIKSFNTIKDKKIRELVDNEFDERKIRSNFIPDPLIQFNPSFERGLSFSELIIKKLLHPELEKIFYGINLYKHQEEAIRLGVNDREFIVTSGTGSGKSLTYLATIFNYILQSSPEKVKNKIIAVLVYPMNALINSQFKEIEKFKIAYEKRYNKTFPITFGQYTGQENEEQRQLLINQFPNILLTNYMMLELAMTRGGRDVEIRENLLKNLKYLVFDELHTYSGRRGSDVAMLIRRIKKTAQFKNNTQKIICIGTSATIVSNEKASLSEQKKEVADVASKILGSSIEADQVITETLTRSLNPSVKLTPGDLKKALHTPVDQEAGAEQFEQHPTALWLEENAALEFKDGVYVRRKPMTLRKLAQKLAEFTHEDENLALTHLTNFLAWNNKLNADPQKKKNYLPYRLHQFIAQTGSLYASLADQKNRKVYLDPGLYGDNKTIRLYPLVFSPHTGHEFWCVRLDASTSKILPRNFEEGSWNDEDKSEETNSFRDGYIFIQHEEESEPVWDFERDCEELPDSWFNPPKKDGSRNLKKDKEKFLPKKIWFRSDGTYSFKDVLDYQGWFIQAPLLLDPTSGHIYDRNTKEWSKLIRLSREGRSTASTILSFEALSLLNAFNQPPEKQKLLSFTDNRQDASLQAGHFNDFIRAGHLRSALIKALENAENKTLDYSNIQYKVFEALNLSQEDYAKYPAQFPGARTENEEALMKYIFYRLLQDLKPGWRVILPNLEQCGLLHIDYKYLKESCADDALWQSHALMARMQPAERYDFLIQIFNYFRTSYALSHSYLESSEIRANLKVIKEKLVYPWTFENNENLEEPRFITLWELAPEAQNLSTRSARYNSALGRYIRRVAASYELQPMVTSGNYTAFVKELFDLCVAGGWLNASNKDIKSKEGQQVQVYRLKVDSILWRKGDGETVIPDLVKNPAFRKNPIKPNAYFKNFYQFDFSKIKTLESREHTGQINVEERKKREEDFRRGRLAVLYCSPTMELGIDIADLSVVHMRNVPPSPANYAQRSGRAGRSGQAALVITFCSHYSPHDRHYFKHAEDMVAGNVKPPRLDLINEELLLTHLNATILIFRALSFPNNSLGDVVDLDQLGELPLRKEVQEAFKFSDSEKLKIQQLFESIINDTYFQNERALRRPSWLTETWMSQNIQNFLINLDRALDRWRSLYRSSQRQIMETTQIINNRAYGDKHEEKDRAHRLLKQAERRRDLLLNAEAKSNGSSRELSEFYPYRYLAAEGFLPGYNFTRLPVRTFVESTEGEGEFISRPRFIALQEFGPQNIVYHDGSKYKVEQIIMHEPELKLLDAKISPKTGYFLYNDQYNYEVDPITQEPMTLDPSKHVHAHLLELGTTRALQLERITCQEEERTRRGYEIQTYFSLDAGLESTTEALVKVHGEKLLHVHYMPACRIFKLNLKWRIAREQGFPLDLTNGFWVSRQRLNELQQKNQAENIKSVKLFTSNTANALYLQPVKALALEGGQAGVITLMYALKRALENYFQVESGEIDAVAIGPENAPNILIYESAEGSLGILSQVVDRPEVFPALMQEAYAVCFCKDGVELQPDASGQYIPATYDDLLSFYNQIHHDILDKNLIREALLKLRQSEIEILSNRAFSSYDEHYQFLQRHRDPNSATEEKFLKFLYNNRLRLPDEVQPRVKDMFVRPDFFYKPNVYIFCDGTPHDRPAVQHDDQIKRQALKNAGYQVLVWHYAEPLEDFVNKRPDIFKKVK